MAFPCLFGIEHLQRMEILQQPFQGFFIVFRPFARINVFHFIGSVSAEQFFVAQHDNFRRQLLHLFGREVKRGGYAHFVFFVYDFRAQSGLAQQNVFFGNARVIAAQHKGKRTPCFVGIQKIGVVFGIVGIGQFAQTRAVDEAGLQKFGGNAVQHRKHTHGFFLVVIKG